MPDLLGAYAMAAAKGPTPAGPSLHALRDWCASKGAPGINDLNGLWSHIESWQPSGGQPDPDPDPGGGGQGG